MGDLWEIHPVFRTPHVSHEVFKVAATTTRQEHAQKAPRRNWTVDSLFPIFYYLDEEHFPLGHAYTSLFPFALATPSSLPPRPHRLHPPAYAKCAYDSCNTASSARIQKPAGAPTSTTHSTPTHSGTSTWKHSVGAAGAVGAARLRLRLRANTPTHPHYTSLQAHYLNEWAQSRLDEDHNDTNRQPEADARSW